MTSADFIAAFPKFDQVDPADVQRWIDRAVISPSFDEGRWGADLNEGLGNYVAHCLCEEGVRGVPVAVTAPSSGAAGGSWRADVYLLEADPLSSTIFGRKYLRLRDEVGMGSYSPGQPACPPWGRW